MDQWDHWPFIEGLPSKTQAHGSTAPENLASPAQKKRLDVEHAFRWAPTIALKRKVWGPY